MVNIRIEVVVDASFLLANLGFTFWSRLGVRLESMSGFMLWFILWFKLGLDFG